MRDQVLSVPVLAAIWSGSIVLWNDPAIGELNEGVDLPPEPIVLVYGDDRRATISDVFASALSEFNSDFGMTANESFSGKWASTMGARALVVGSGPEQIGYVAVRPHRSSVACPVSTKATRTRTHTHRTSRAVSRTARQCSAICSACVTPS
jgi:hypothetical protein